MLKTHGRRGRRWWALRPCTSLPAFAKDLQPCHRQRRGRRCCRQDHRFLLASKHSLHTLQLLLTSLRRCVIKVHVIMLSENFDIIGTAKRDYDLMKTGRQHCCPIPCATRRRRVPSHCAWPGERLMPATLLICFPREFQPSTGACAPASNPSRTSPWYLMICEWACLERRL